MTISGKRIQGTNVNGKIVIGEVVLVYTDALASGTRDYVPVTYLSVLDDENCIHTMRPRDLIQTMEK